jgi:hypothetical protein
LSCPWTHTPFIVLFFLFVTLFAYLCSPFHTYLPPPCLVGSRIVYGPHFRSCSLRAFILYFLFSHWVWDTLRSHYEQNHINTYIHTDTNIGVVVLIIVCTEKQKSFWVSPKHRGRGKNNVSCPWPCLALLGMTATKFGSLSRSASGPLTRPTLAVCNVLVVKDDVMKPFA